MLLDYMSSLCYRCSRTQ